MTSVLQPRTFAANETKSSITLGCPILNKTIRGGLRCGCITEISGMAQNFSCVWPIRILHTPCTMLSSCSHLVKLLVNLLLTVTMHRAHRDVPETMNNQIACQHDCPGPACKAKCIITRDAVPCMNLRSCSMQHSACSTHSPWNAQAHVACMGCTRDNACRRSWCSQDPDCSSISGQCATTHRAGWSEWLCNVSGVIAQ